LNYLLNKNKICAVIPFFNEIRSLSDVVKKTLNYVDVIILVNDGSTDGSENSVNERRTVLINHKKNFGKGKALKTGFLKSLELKCNVTVTLDADGQHDPKFIPELIEKIPEYDLVIGNRLADMSSMPLNRRFSNKLTSKLLSLKTGVKILDSQSGYRVYKTGKLMELLPQSNGFEAESEILIKAARNKLNIGFSNISTIYGNDNSKMKSIQAILGFIKVLLFS